jgi:adenylate kinase family enzyme
MGTNVDRVVILASASCSGKTTLGRELARRLDARFVELDALNHGPNWAQATPEELRERVEPLLAEPRWVVDGSYRSKLGDTVLERSDLVVWLDLPRRVWLPRLVRRTLRRVVRRERLWNDNRETLWNGFFARDSLLRFALRTYGPRRRTYPTELGRYNLVRLGSTREIDRWLETVP